MNDEWSSEILNWNPAEAGEELPSLYSIAREDDTTPTITLERLIEAIEKLYAAHKLAQENSAIEHARFTASLTKIQAEINAQIRAIQATKA